MTMSYPAVFDVMSFADINILLFQLVGKLLLKMLGIVSCSRLLINPSNPSDFLEMSREIGWGPSSPLLKVFSAGKTRHLFLCCLTSDIQGGWTVCPVPNKHKEYKVYFFFSHAEFWQQQAQREAMLLPEKGWVPVRDVVRMEDLICLTKLGRPGYLLTSATWSPCSW